MLCGEFKCVYLDENDECEATGTECLGDMCDNYGECFSCQEQDHDKCDGLK